MDALSIRVSGEKNGEGCKTLTDIDILINALIWFGMGFFSAGLSAQVILQNSAEALLAGGIAGGIQFFTYLLGARGLKK